MPKIRIAVNTKGEVKMDMAGYVGVSCKSAGEPFVRALGVPKEEKPKDPEELATHDDTVTA